MNLFGWRAAAIGLVSILLLFVGAGIGGSLVIGHYRPLLEQAESELTTSIEVRKNLEELVGEQGRKLGELVLAGAKRETEAEQAIAKADAEAQPNFEAANRIQRENIAGDPCKVVAAVIDQELGL